MAYLFRKPAVALLLLSVMVGSLVFVFDLKQVENQKNPRGYFQYFPHSDQQIDLSPNNQVVRGLVGKVDIVNMKESFEPKDQIWLKWDNEILPASDVFSDLIPRVFLIPSACSFESLFDPKDDCTTVIDGAYFNPEYYLQVPSFVLGESEDLSPEEYSSRITNAAINDLKNRGLFLSISFEEASVDGFNLLNFPPPGLYKIIIAGNNGSFLESSTIKIVEPKLLDPYSLKRGDNIYGSVVKNISVHDSNWASIEFSGTTTIKGLLSVEERKYVYSSTNDPKEYVVVLRPTDKTIPFLSSRPIVLPNIKINDPRIGTEQVVKVGDYFINGNATGANPDRWGSAQHAEIVP